MTGVLPAIVFEVRFTLTPAVVASPHPPVAACCPVDGRDWGVLGQRAAESFFGTLKRELAHKRSWATRADARRDLIRWIEGWFNPHRLHSSIGYRSPIEAETDWYHQHAEATNEAA